MEVIAIEKKTYEAMMETEAMRTIQSEQGFIDLYCIEMITMLSFRIVTPQAKTLRGWIIGRLSEKIVSSPSMIIYYTVGGQHC